MVAVLAVLGASREMRDLKVEQPVRVNNGTGLLKCVCTVVMLDNGQYKTVECATPNCKRREHLYCLFRANRMPEWARFEHRCIKCRMYFADPFWMNARADDIVPPTLIRGIPQRPPVFNQVIPWERAFGEIEHRRCRQWGSRWCPRSLS